MFNTFIGTALVISCLDIFVTVFRNVTNFHLLLRGKELLCEAVKIRHKIMCLWLFLTPTIIFAVFTGLILCDIFLPTAVNRHLRMLL